MALDIRNLPDEIVYGLVAAHNEQLAESVGTDHVHLDVTSDTNRADYKNPTKSSVQVTAATATDETTLVTLVNGIKSVVNRHFADTVAHDTATSAAISVADATNAATALTLINDIKGKFNTHRGASNVHFNNDAGNEVTNADGTNQATSITLANEVKGDVNSHIVLAPPGTFIKLVDA
jgi:hypothetical protein